MRRWEYHSTSAPIVRAEIDALGVCGWELCAVTSEIAWFKRDRDARLLDEQGARHAIQRGDK